MIISLSIILSAATTWMGLWPIHPRISRLGYGVSSAYPSIVSPFINILRTSLSLILLWNILWIACVRNIMLVDSFNRPYLHTRQTNVLPCSENIPEKSSKIIPWRLKVRSCYPVNRSDPCFFCVAPACTNYSPNVFCPPSDGMENTRVATAVPSKSKNRLLYP